ncbi:FAD-dependent oxidoreductase [Dermacoccaceae bacterium W4C1]
MTGSPLAQLDRLLGRVTMYRLVTILLTVLGALALLFAATGRLDSSIFGVGDMLLSLVVLMVASVGSSLLLGLIFRAKPHPESAVITAWLLWFLYWPQSGATLLTWLAVVAVAANASKYLLAWRGRHIFNPAAAGVVLVLLIQELIGSQPQDRLTTTWWVANSSLMPFVLVAALLVLRRTHHLRLGAVFTLVAGGLLLVSTLSQGSDLRPALEAAFVSSPIFFFAGFMLSEPLTLPSRKHWQLVAAAVAGVVYSWPIWGPALISAETTSWWVFESWLEPALLVANLIGFATGQRRRVRMELLRKRELASGTWAFDFAPERPVRFKAGQYLEVHLPHSDTDGRGVRRVFSIASPPGADELTLALRVPADRASSFKKALTELPTGTKVAATGVNGDFLLPSATRPLALVAGGIGITPFLAQLPQLRDRDAVLVYALPEASQVPFAEELRAAGVPVVLVSPEAPQDLPEGWSHVPASAVTAQVLAQAVPDLKSRQVHVSGSPAMAHGVRTSLRGQCAGIRTDYFSGY